jgi:hypothetical protein
MEGMLIGFGHGHRWSAFAGFVVLLVGWPLNSYVARRRVRMHKGELKARDGRMSVVNELIGSVRGSPSFTCRRLVWFSRFCFLFTAKERKG